MPKVSTQVYMLDHKILKLFRPHGSGRKKTKCDQFFCPTSDFFDFCTPCFFYHTFPMMWILLTKPMQKSVNTVCLHCSFARLKNKHNRSRPTGDRCSHNKLYLIFFCQSVGRAGKKHKLPALHVNLQAKVIE